MFFRVFGPYLFERCHCFLSRASVGVSEDPSVESGCIESRTGEFWLKWGPASGSPAASIATVKPAS